MQPQSRSLLAFQKCLGPEWFSETTFELRWPQGRGGCRGAQAEGGYPVEESSEPLSFVSGS